ncbi:hypothetical protein G3N55_06195 [Dissulfurirhabdus thermomarina]|uniref:Uncharacterized protein n=1 Tax=Dissulfurirhabdus thermomarina TaxID=1765737 RepID=A0A6N9TMC4_DISTH|nr:hypothetical protein [Dissulfurirhabdus thermomarina]NDY42432.1 hypothetical protein [Dissulfurirhabdus thermomarina]NMX24087.1 hypothetical protein [Dissulfurirhabdus thermomarina]
MRILKTDALLFVLFTAAWMVLDATNWRTAFFPEFAKGLGFTLGLVFAVFLVANRGLVRGNDRVKRLLGAAAAAAVLTAAWYAAATMAAYHFRMTFVGHL